MSDERLAEDTLFLACTRPAMVLGVTMEAFGVNVMFSSILFILGGSLLYGLVAVPIHLACRLLCRHDPNQFRLLFAWFDTRGRHRNGRLWGGSSCTPLRLKRCYTARDLGHE